jgi:hypothetical protein
MMYCLLHIKKFANIKVYPQEISIYDRSFKLRKVSDVLNLRLSKVNYPTEHVSIDESTVFFKEKLCSGSIFLKLKHWNQTLQTM